MVLVVVMSLWRAVLIRSRSRSRLRPRLQSQSRVRAKVKAESGLQPGLEPRRRADASVVKVLSRVVVGDPGKRVVSE